MRASRRNRAAAARTAYGSRFVLTLTGWPHCAVALTWLRRARSGGALSGSRRVAGSALQPARRSFSEGGSVLKNEPQALPSAEALIRQ